MPKRGSRAQVWHGTAEKTSGGLTKDDLMMSRGRIVSKRMHEIGKRMYKQNNLRPRTAEEMAAIRPNRRKTVPIPPPMGQDAEGLDPYD